jgi:ATP-dependent RNA helicase DDX35
LVVSSATLDAEEMKDFFETNVTNDPKNDVATIISIEGRTYPVDVHYLLNPCQDYLAASLDTVMNIHTTQPTGDILVFLTGQEEIDTLVQLIKERAALIQVPNKTAAKLKPVPIYAGLPAERQMKVFAPTTPMVRKVVIATNIAETSITIDGIVYVVD